MAHSKIVVFTLMWQKMPVLSDIGTRQTLMHVWSTANALLCSANASLCNTPFLFLSTSSCTFVIPASFVFCRKFVKLLQQRPTVRVSSGLQCVMLVSSLLLSFQLYVAGLCPNLLSQQVADLFQPDVRVHSINGWTRHCCFVVSTCHQSSPPDSMYARHLLTACTAVAS